MFAILALVALISVLFVGLLKMRNVNTASPNKNAHNEQENFISNVEETKLVPTVTQDDKENTEKTHPNAAVNKAEKQLSRRNTVLFNSPPKATDVSAAVPVAPSVNMEMIEKMVEHVPSDALGPSEDPATELSDAIQTLSEGDVWYEEVGALTSIRRVVVRYRDTFLQQQEAALHAVVQGINARRSAVTKNALVCVADIMTSLRTLMDDHLTELLPPLFRRTCEKSFLKDDAIAALISIIDFASPQPAMEAIQAAATHKHPLVRCAAARCLEHAVNVWGLDGIDIQQFVLPLLCKLFGESSAETRARAKGGLSTLQKMYRQAGDDLANHLGSVNASQSKKILTAAS